jgi:hypothetical protein
MRWMDLSSLSFLSLSALELEPDSSSVNTICWNASLLLPSSCCCCFGTGEERPCCRCILEAVLCARWPNAFGRCGWPERMEPGPVGAAASVSGALDK